MGQEEHVIQVETMKKRPLVPYLLSPFYEKVL